MDFDIFMFVGVLLADDKTQWAEDKCATHDATGAAGLG